jgi:L-seryl-tRNA(Ser) seleniumtransferase
MTLHHRLALTPVINAAGTFTPLGVSRSSPTVRAAAAQALGEFLVIEELQQRAGAAIAGWTGAQAGAVAHCVAGAITMAVAAAIAGEDADAIATLPDAGDRPHRVLLPAGHAVDYGHPITQDIRLAGGVPVPAGDEDGCSVAELEQALASGGIACLLLVSSRLTRGPAIDLAAAVAAAHRHGVPAFIDGAAQDMRLPELLATGADLVLASGHKYLASPTIGLVASKGAWVRAFRAQERGIGRAMKPAKEAIVGLLAAIEERRELDLRQWTDLQAHKTAEFVERCARLPGIAARAQPDPSGMPFSRAHLRIDPQSAGIDAAGLVAALADGNPSIRVMTHRLADEELVLELVPLEPAEIEAIIARLEALLAGSPAGC